MSVTLHEEINAVRSKLNTEVVGQEHLTERILIALLADGHLLVEGPPGLAKTRAIKTLSHLIEGDFHRIQFTPDLLPADITGSEIFRPQEGSFHFQKGPIFHNLILADEINRSPAKVQSALLEAMGEHQVTVGAETWQLPRLFLVMATQNPLEQEGTYPLPEAQLDRFLMHILIDYPNAETELKILNIARADFLNDSEKKDATLTDILTLPSSPAKLTQESLFAIRKELPSLYMSPELERYLVEIVMATRNPESYGDGLSRWLEWGASPRGCIGLDRCSRAHAWMKGRDFVTPDDIQEVAADVLRHRIVLSYEALSEGVNSTQVINSVLDHVPVP